MLRTIAVFKCNVFLPKRDTDKFKKEIQEGIDKGLLVLPPELDMQLITIDDSKAEGISGVEFINDFVYKHGGD